MLDIRFIRENLDRVRENIAYRGVKNANPDLVVEIYNRRVSLLQALERLRAERNETAQKMKGKLEPEERQVLIERGRMLKEEIAGLETEVDRLAEELEAEARHIPNMTHPAVPGGGEDEGTVLQHVGEPRTFDFEPKDHLALGTDLRLLDFDTAAEVTGQKFYYLLNEGALLEMALINFAMSKLVARGFTPYLTPDLARTSVLEAIGFDPRGESTQVYTVAGTDLCLVGTAEITLGGLLKDRILRKEDLPVRLVGFSHCFRTEAGSHGAFAKGLYRVHQFSKVEMFAFTTPEESERMHEEMRDIEIEIFTELGLPFRVVDIAAGDLGAPAYRKFDLEAWMPSRGGYGEVTSTSNCTDFQSRRLAIRYRDEENQTRLVHTLNGTAVAIPRAIVAILENNQQADGTVVVPEVLRPFMGGQGVIGREKSWEKR
ncbi:MAG TPA: serine--tRNA ligase [Candidatus Kapabacteria bacterium]|nr:serine--tRNA ligase [Candidatus Kapabacteria bacterium]